MLENMFDLGAGGGHMAQAQQYARTVVQQLEPGLQAHAGELEDLDPLAADRIALTTYGGLVRTAFYHGVVASFPPPALATWELGDDEEDCEQCQLRDGEVFNANNIYYWPGEPCESADGCSCRLEMSPGELNDMDGTSL